MAGSHLAIQSQQASIRFDLIRNGSSINHYLIELKGVESDDRDSLETFFKENPSLVDAENVTLSWYSPKSTLVPNVIFNESNPLEIFQLCYGKETDSHDVDYNRIPELGLIHVFDFPSWLKRYFVIKFPRIIIQHEGTHLLRKFMQSAFKPKANIVLHENHFSLAIAKHNKLEFYSHFDYQSIEDVIYYLAYTLQQKELDMDGGSIEFCNSQPSPLFEQFTKHIERIAELNKTKLIENDHFVAEAHLLCV